MVLPHVAVEVNHADEASEFLWRGGPRHHFDGGYLVGHWLDAFVREPEDEVFNFRLEEFAFLGVDLEAFVVKAFEYGVKRRKKLVERGLPEDKEVVDVCTDVFKTVH